MINTKKLIRSDSRVRAFMRNQRLVVMDFLFVQEDVGLHLSIDFELRRTGRILLLGRTLDETDRMVRQIIRALREQVFIPNKHRRPHIEHAVLVIKQASVFFTGLEKIIILCPQFLCGQFFVVFHFSLFQWF